MLKNKPSLKARLISLAVLGMLLLPISVLADTIFFDEGFDDDFVAGRKGPDLVDTSLSTPFSEINEKRPNSSGFLTLRDRDITEEGGEGGGFPPANDVILDFTDGMGSYVTFRFSTSGKSLVVGPDSFITFDVVAYGGDGGSLFKYVSSDGITFTQVGDSSSDNGQYKFDLATGGTETFFKLQVGTATDIYEGVHIDHLQAYVVVEGPNLTGEWDELLSSKRGKRISGRFRVENVGDRDTSKFKVAFYLSNDGKSLGKLLKKINLSKGIKAGDDKTLSLIHTSKKSLSGMYIIAMVDSENQVDETNESEVDNKISEEIP